MEWPTPSLKISHERNSCIYRARHQFQERQALVLPLPQTDQYSVLDQNFKNAGFDYSSKLKMCCQTCGLDTSGTAADKHLT